MVHILDQWNWKRIFLLLVLPNLVLAGLAILTEAPFLIVVQNVILIGVSAAICIAFLPEVIDGFRNDRPLTPEFTISLGIVASWADWSLRALVSLTFRGVPGLKWIVDSDINSAILFWTLCAAMCHLQAPQVINGRVPAKKWIRVGIITGIGLMAATLLIYHRPISVYMRAAWYGQHVQDDRYIATASTEEVLDALRRGDVEPLLTDTGKGPFSEPLQARISKELAERLEDWRAGQTPIPSRSAAVRRLLGQALDAETQAPPKR